MRTFIRRTLIVASATSALGLSAVPSEAQSTAGRRWQAWVGCWTGIAADEFAAVRENINAPTTVCITPSGDADIVDVTTVADGKVVSRTKLDASGREQAVQAAGCTGTQRAQWSADERRVYLKSTAMCEGIRTSTSGILAISPTGEWLDVRGVSAGAGDNVRVARYRDVGIPASLPTEIASALTGRTMATQSARVAAGAAVGTTAIIDAVKMSDAAVVEAWLLERQQPFAINAHDLVALADAGVPARVTDALVAVSNPKAFAIGRADPRSGYSDSDVIAGRRIFVNMGPAYDPWGYGYSPYGYGYGSGYGYGYNGYGRSGYGYGSYYPPVIIVQDQPAQAHGRVERGGYTRGGSQSTPSTSSSQPSSTSSNNGSSSSGTSSSQPSSPAPERTAKPKP